MWERVNPAPVQLTSEPVSCRYPTPSLDGRKIYVIGEQNHGGELYRFDLKTRQYVHFLPGLSAEFLAYSNDGEWIAWVSFPEGVLWRSRADGSERLQLTTPPAKVFLPRWSPDGKKIAYFEQPKGGFPFVGESFELRIISADGTTLERDPTHGNSGRNSADLHWSPDGKSLIWWPGSGPVKTLDLFTNQISDFPGSDDFMAPRWSQDGRYSVWGSQDATRLMLLDQASHRWTELVKMDFILFPTITRDGKYVYFFNNATLCRVRVSDHKLEELATRKDLELNGSLGVPWLGLTPDGSPIVMRNLRAWDILALDWEAP